MWNRNPPKDTQKESCCAQVKAGILVDMALAGHRKVSLKEESIWNINIALWKTRQISHSFIQPALI